MEKNMTRRLRVAHVTTIDLTLRMLLLEQLKCLRDEGFEVTTISAPGPWVRYIEDEGIRHIPWPHATRSWNPRHDLRAFYELIRIFRSERFDIVHTHNPKPGVMGRVAARLARVPVVMNTVHGFGARPDDRLNKRFVFMSLEWLAARFSDLELYQSTEDLSRGRKMFIKPQEKCVHLGNGVDLRRFDPRMILPDARDRVREEFGFRSEDLVVGTVGRLVGEKGYREFFDAARLVCSQNDRIKFLAIGDGDPAKGDAISSEEMASAGKFVSFTGWREDIPELVAALDVFVLVSWREGMPRSAMEAAAMGKPMILSNIPGCRQIAQHEVEALFVSPRDAQELANAVERLASDDEMRAGMGAAARATALRRFDEQKVAATVVALSRKLAQNGKTDAMERVSN
jgi:glycosyltransferase involved in cell wall biosynthesis